MSRISDLLKQLADFSAVQLKSELNGMTPTIWSEGGEWLSVAGALFRERKPIRDFDYDFIPVNTVDHALLEVESNDVSYLLMRCGAGKSTILASRLSAMKFSSVTLVVIPSAITAKLLAQYVTKTIRKADVLDVFNCSVGFYYVSAAQVLAWIISGNDLSDVTFIVDEAHCVTPVYRALKTWLTTVNNKVVFMTASVGTAWITSNVDCAVSFISEITQLEKEKYGDHFASETALVVGVEDGNQAASPANLFVGNTVKISLLMDSGLRLDPIYKDGKIFHGERVAQQTEVIQMTGRIGRGRTQGIAVVVKDARASKSLETRLYDVVYDVYCSLLGMDTHANFTTALVAFGKLTGFETREILLTDVVLSDNLQSAVRSGLEVELMTENGIKRLSLTSIMDQGYVVRTDNVLRFTTYSTRAELEITYEQIQNARLVLAERMVPDFSTIEYKTVVFLFHRIAKSSGKRMSDMVVSQFVEYFRRFSTYHKTSGIILELDEVFE
jgi:hypothetical protein